MAVAVEPRAKALPGQVWIQAATTASVIILAVIAAVVSYGHMHALALQHGEGAWASALIPLSVDGMIVASSMALLSDSRRGGRGGVLPWTLLIIGAAASLAANIAVAEPSVAGRVIAAWPSFALTASYELLMRQIRQSAVHRTRSQHQPQPARTSGRQAQESQMETSVPTLSQDVAPTVAGRADGAAARAAAGGSRLLQRQAWQWALANRRSDGSLPIGSEVARQFRRSERWGRLVKNTGLTGQLDRST